MPCPDQFEPTTDEVASLLKTKFGDKITIRELSEQDKLNPAKSKRRLYARVDRDSILEVCNYVHDKLDFEHASSLCGVDWVTHMQVVYHLSSYVTGIILELIVDIPNDDLRIDSVANIWEGANWHERETYELFGIVFEGHPNLVRLLTPDDYEFFPFRKSYKLRGQE